MNRIDTNKAFRLKIEFKEKLFLLLIISVNFLIKAIPAAMVEFGNDEVYYWTYALFPDFSHFDHPPMVGFTIQLFSLNLLLNSEFFIRLGSLMLSSAGIIFLFYLVKRIYSLQAAYISAFLFTASVYFNVISGLFILPDTPQVFFVILALYSGIPAVLSREPSKTDSRNFILFGLFSGLAFLSKYHSLFLWFGTGLYILFYNRIWFKKNSFYISLFLTLVATIPVVYWNARNDFVSFTFHESRVGLFNSPVDFISFVQFNAGQFFYQNPILFIVFLITLVSLFRNKRGRLKDREILLLFLSLPLILIFILFSLFQKTLPHWSGPAFIGLIILSSGWLSEKLTTRPRKVLMILLSSNLLVLLLLVLAPLQINYGLIWHPQKSADPKKTGSNDLTLEMYGWKQARVKFLEFLEKKGIEEKDYDRVKIISNKWFPAAHLDYYIAHPLDMELLVSGTLDQSHKYFWINKTRSIDPGDIVYYITTSMQFYDPERLINGGGQIISMDTIAIKRNGTTVKNLFLFGMKGPFKNLP
jgi:hypothetical protein